MRGNMQQIVIGLPPEVVDELDAAAYRENRSRAKVIEEALRKAFDLPRKAAAPKRRSRAQPVRLEPSLAVSA
jgi:metal-responsive CopG/Arc/MetJ family transcriptional regulator